MPKSKQRSYADGTRKALPSIDELLESGKILSELPDADEMLYYGDEGEGDKFHTPLFDLRREKIKKDIITLLNSVSDETLKEIWGRLNSETVSGSDSNTPTRNEPIGEPSFRTGWIPTSELPAELADKRRASENARQKERRRNETPEAAEIRRAKQTQRVREWRARQSRSEP
jgi:hypothetical protein